jgi:hypothetical protein
MVVKSLITLAPRDDVNFFCCKLRSQQNKLVCSIQATKLVIIVTTVSYDRKMFIKSVTNVEKRLWDKKCRIELHQNTFCRN